MSDLTYQDGSYKTPQDRIAALEKRCAELEAHNQKLSGALEFTREWVSLLNEREYPDNMVLACDVRAKEVRLCREALSTTPDNTALASLLKPTMELLDWCEKVAANHHAYPLQSAIRTERQRLEGICKP